ncbi:MAG: hypothetical protein DWP94_15205 [Flavobacterium sp.]|nr:MAG: hypothetical protein DWP94_15205 [Flavobacterium sp.]
MNNNNDKLYLKAFNDGYILAKFNSHLINKLLESKIDSPYFDGLRDGNLEFVQQLKLSRLNELDKLDKDKSQNRDIER